MSSAKVLGSLLGLFIVAATAAYAVLEDHTWSLNGTLTSGSAANEIYIAVNNDTAFSAASIEVHYDTTLIEINEPLEEKAQLIGRASDLTLLPSKLPGWDYVRITFFSSSSEQPYPDLEVGTGDIVKLIFRVKVGVSTQNTTLQLTTKSSKALLATQVIEIQGGLPDPGNPEDFNWSMSGVLVADSLETGTLVRVKNELWFSSAVFDVFYDTTLLEIKQPLADNVLMIKRAAAMNYTPSHEEGWDYVRLTLFPSEEDPTIPRIDAGSGAIASLKFNIKTPFQGGETTSLHVKLADGTEMASLTLTARVFTGPTADLSGDGKEDIFDVIEFLRVLSGNVPKSAFSDVDGNGKTDIFDLIEILIRLKN